MKVGKARPDTSTFGCFHFAVIDSCNWSDSGRLERERARERLEREGGGKLEKKKSGDSIDAEFFLFISAMSGLIS